MRRTASVVTRTPFCGWTISALPIQECVYCRLTKRQVKGRYSTTSRPPPAAKLTPLTATPKTSRCASDSEANRLVRRSTRRAAFCAKPGCQLRRSPFDRRTGPGRRGKDDGRREEPSGARRRKTKSRRSDWRPENPSPGSRPLRPEFASAAKDEPLQSHRQRCYFRRR